jgi:hypothetical protein
MKVKTQRQKRASGLTKRLTTANKPQTQKRYKKAPTRRKKFKTGRRKK